MFKGGSTVSIWCYISQGAGQVSSDVAMVIMVVVCHKFYLIEQYSTGNMMTIRA